VACFLGRTNRGRCLKSPHCFDSGETALDTSDVVERQASAQATSMEWGTHRMDAIAPGSISKVLSIADGLKPVSMRSRVQPA